MSKVDLKRNVVNGIVALGALAILAGGIVGAGSIVSLVGLDGVTSVEQVTWDIRFNLALFFLPLYCALYLAGLWIVSRYRIDRTGHAENLARLSERAVATR